MENKTFLIGRILFRVLHCTHPTDGGCSCETFDLVTGDYEKGIYDMHAFRHAREVSADAIDRALALRDDYYTNLTTLEMTLKNE